LFVAILVFFLFVGCWVYVGSAEEVLTPAQDIVLRD
jgi:hypothetical protein